MIILFAERGRYEVYGISTTLSVHRGYILGCDVITFDVVSQNTVLSNSIKSSITCVVDSIAIASIDTLFPHTINTMLTCVSKNILSRFIQHASSVSTTRTMDVTSFSLNGVQINNTNNYNLIGSGINLNLSTFIDISKSINIDVGTLALTTASNVFNQIQHYNITPTTNTMSILFSDILLDRFVSSTVNVGIFVLNNTSITFNKSLSFDCDNAQYTLSLVDITDGRDYVLDIQSKFIYSRFSVLKFLKNNLPIKDPCQI